MTSEKSKSEAGSKASVDKLDEMTSQKSVELRRSTKKSTKGGSGLGCKKPSGGGGPKDTDEMTSYKSGDRRQSNKKSTVGGGRGRKKPSGGGGHEIV